MAQVIFPLFIHVYLSLVAGGHSDTGESTVQWDVSLVKCTCAVLGGTLVAWILDYMYCRCTLYMVGVNG